MTGRGPNSVVVAASGKSSVPLTRAFSFIGIVAYVESISDRRGWSLIFHIGVLALIAWIPSILLAFLIHLAFPAQKNPDLFSDPYRAIVGAIIASPLIETLAMRYIFVFLRKITLKPLGLSGLSAVIWGVIHFPFAGAGLHAVWPFFILSLCYLRLEVVSFTRAILITALIHGLCNGLSYGLYLLLYRIAT